ncbi:hypothetical protein [Pontibacter russatus]|uniref:hypothetical protein n=1 Tax=Pontibacter russatus TaxID=2694929 RepID=UPI001379D10D|nr:hypothetical protein [Pontibacter russatus]
MNFHFTDAVLARAGKLYLHLRLRKREKVERELNLKYGGQYRNAGLVLLLDLLMALAVVAVVSLLAAVIYGIIA